MTSLLYSNSSEQDGLLCPKILTKLRHISALVKSYLTPNLYAFLINGT